MLLFGGAFGIVLFAVWVFCIFDVITTPDRRIRNLPKLLWLLVVIVLFDIGALVWLVAGRPWGQPDPGAEETGERRGFGGGFGGSGGGIFGSGEGARARTSSFGRPAASTRRARPTNPDDDPEFLAILQQRADDLRKQRETKPDDGPAAG